MSSGKVAERTAGKKRNQHLEEYKALMHDVGVLTYNRNGQSPISLAH